MTGDVPRTIELARRALELVPEDDHVGRGGPRPSSPSATGRTVIWRRRTGRIRRPWRASREPATLLMSSVVGRLGDILIAQGRLDDAMATYERGLRLARSQGGPALRGAADMHVGMSALFRERNDLATASHHLDLSRELGDDERLPQNPYRCAWQRLGSARRGRSRRRGRHCSMRQSASTSVTSPRTCALSPLSGEGAGSRRVELDTPRWARERRLAPYGRPELPPRVRVRNARAIAPRPSRETERRARSARRSTSRGGSWPPPRRAAEPGAVIDVLVVLALARHGRRRPRWCDGFTRPCRRAGRTGGLCPRLPRRRAAMTALLGRSKTARRLGVHTNAPSPRAVTPESTGPPNRPLIEPLSERELDVLRLLRSELDGPAIARELVVSLNTVRTHTQNVYAKLGVNSRRAAVQPRGGARPPLSPAGRPPGLTTLITPGDAGSSPCLHLRSSDTDRSRRTGDPEGRSAMTDPTSRGIARPIGTGSG